MTDAAGPDLLLQYEDNWVTAMGAWFPEGRVVLRGKDVLNDLGHRRWMEYLIYAVLGRESPGLARLIEGLWTLGSSYPEPRIWNNRVAALAGTARSTVTLALAAGTAVSEATLYGLRTSKGAIDFLQRADRKLKDGQRLADVVQEELRKYRAVYGYGRPIVSGDERIAPVLRLAKTLGYENGHYVGLALKIHDYLKNSRYKYQINMSAVAAALMADHGFSPDDFHRLACLSFVGGMLPCYIDTHDKPEGSFFPLRTRRIDYRGTPERHWGEA